MTPTDSATAPPGVAASPTVRDYRALRVEQVMDARPATVGPEATLGELAALLARHRVGCVPVVDDGAPGEGCRLVGLIGERELVQAVTTVRCPQWCAEDPVAAVTGAPVRELMRHRPFSIRPDDDLVHAARHLVRTAATLVPVTTDERLVGVLAMADVVRLLGGPDGAAPRRHRAPGLAPV